MLTYISITVSCLAVLACSGAGIFNYCAYKKNNDKTCLMFVYIMIPLVIMNIVFLCLNVSQLNKSKPKPIKPKVEVYNTFKSKDPF